LRVTFDTNGSSPSNVHTTWPSKDILVPVVIDGTRDQEAVVPDAFRHVQWTRLPAGETPPEFVTRIQKLLSGGGVRSSTTMARGRLR